MHVAFGGFTLLLKPSSAAPPCRRNGTVSLKSPPPPAGIYDPDQTGSGLLDILRGGTERFLTNIKDTSSKVIQSVARYDTGLHVVESDRSVILLLLIFIVLD